MPEIRVASKLIMPWQSTAIVVMLDTPGALPHHTEQDQEDRGREHSTEPTHRVLACIPRSPPGCCTVRDCVETLSYGENQGNTWRVRGVLGVHEYAHLAHLFINRERGGRYSENRVGGKQRCDVGSWR